MEHDVTELMERTSILQSRLKSSAYKNYLLKTQIIALRDQLASTNDRLAMIESIIHTRRVCCYCKRLRVAKVCSKCRAKQYLNYTY